MACLNITAFLAALAAAYICDILGRRMSVRIGGLVYLVAAIIQILSPDLACLIVGRSLQGVGVGAAPGVVTMNYRCADGLHICYSVV